MNTSASPALPIHVRRIYSEYLEMPGLRLTSAQAQRLLGLEADVCADALQFLIDTGFLRRTDGGQYVRLADGLVASSPMRMARATLGRQHNAKAS